MVNIQDNPLYYAATGGFIIGISASLNYVLRGRITGMSGIIYSVISLNKDDMPKNISLIGGMLLISGVFFNIFRYQTYNKFTPFGSQDQITINTSLFGFALAGILVGFGTKISNGCTSGHGLCGLARLKIRSFVAVIIFVSSGFVISTIIYHTGGLGPFTQTQFSPRISYNHLVSANFSIVLGVLLPFVGYYMRIRATNQAIGQTSQVSLQRKVEEKAPYYLFAQDQLILFIVGLVFGVGVLVSGMIRRSNIIGYLAAGKDWNPSLLFVFGSGLAVNLVFFNYMIKVKKTPLLAQKLENPNYNVIDIRLIGGAVCFGLGWGLGGLCPAPAIMHFSIFTIDVHLVWFPFFFMGQFIAYKINQFFPAVLTNQVTEVKSQKSTSKIIVQDQLVKDKQNINIGSFQAFRQQRIDKNFGQRQKVNFSFMNQQSLRTSKDSIRIFNSQEHNRQN